MQKIAEPVYDPKFGRHYQEVVFEYNDDMPEGYQVLQEGEWRDSFYQKWTSPSASTYRRRIPCDPPETDSSPQEVKKLYAVGFYGDRGQPCIYFDAHEDVWDAIKCINSKLQEELGSYFVAELNIIGTAQRQVVKTGVLAEGKGE